AGDGLDEEQQDDRAEEAGQEAEDQSAAFDVHAEDLQQETTDEAADDADDDVEENALLGVGAHDLAADPTGETTDDDPTEDSESEHVQSFREHWLVRLNSDTQSSHQPHLSLLTSSEWHVCDVRKVGFGGSAARAVCPTGTARTGTLVRMTQPPVTITVTGHAERTVAPNRCTVVLRV